MKTFYCFHYFILFILLARRVTGKGYLKNESIVIAMESFIIQGGRGSLMKDLGFTYPSYIKNNVIMYIHDQRINSHEQIIALNDILLTPGFHCLKAKNLLSGRVIIDTFLMSLNYFHTIGCLTMEKKQLSGNIQNIYQQLEQGGYLQQGSDGIERFLVNAFYCDFILIEMQPTLITRSWLPMFQQKLIDLGIDQTIPIVYLLYES